MKLLQLFCLSLLSACSFYSLNKAEIRNLEQHSFEDLTLIPTYDLFDFRLDIIRQTTTETNSDSTENSVDVAYHQLGFDLGNGLFFDLNDNLSIDFLKLLSVNKEGNFMLHKTYFRKKPYSIKLSLNDSTLCLERPALFKKHAQYCKQIKRAENRITLYQNDRELCSIEETPGQISIQNRKNKVLSQITKIDTNKYKKGRRKKNNTYELVNEHQVNLGRYLVELNPSKTELSIRLNSKRKDHLLYKIIKNKETLFIYSKKYKGYKVELREKQIAVFSNQRPLYKLEVQ